MNKAEISKKVSERSGVDFEECIKVINTFEKILEEELSDSKGLGRAFDKIYSVMNFFKGKNENKN